MLFFFSFKYSKTANHSIWERTTQGHEHENVRKYPKHGPTKLITLHYINLGQCPIVQRKLQHRCLAWTSVHLDLIWKAKEQKINKADCSCVFDAKAEERLAKCIALVCNYGFSPSMKQIEVRAYMDAFFTRTY